ncbi:MAG: hypothetical protein PHN75_08025, partial [Syntrophales bacterium]|nr:hypothetical protein [Syntrophales bacterium]
QKQALAIEKRRLEEERRKIEESVVSSGSAADAYGRVVFYDDLNARRNWPVYEKGEYYDAYYRDLRYVMETKNDRKSMEVISLPAEATGDYDIELNTTWQQGIKDSAYGLILGEDRASSYIFGVSANGQSVIWMTEKDVPVQDAMPWKANTAKVSDGRYVENMLRVEVRGKNLKYYVNNNLLTSIRSRFALKTFGLCVSRQQRVAFTMIKITKR